MKFSTYYSMHGQMEMKLQKVMPELCWEKMVMSKLLEEDGDVKVDSEDTSDNGSD